MAKIKNEVSDDGFKKFSRNLCKSIEDLRRVEKGLSISGDSKTLTRMVAHREILQLILDSMPI